jgi:ketosteroid isomerase-like protein
METNTGRYCAEMSRENVEVVRAIYEAAARGHSDDVLGFYDPDVEWDVSQSPYRPVVGRDLYRGHEGLRRFFRDYRDPWRVIEDDCEDLIDAGAQVISVVTTRARGKASGAEVEATFQAGVWTLEEGRIVHVTWFSTRSEALEAAGLAE